jgi:hypothetical protein
MSHFLQNIDLASHPLHVRLILNFVLLQNLDRHLLVRYRVGAYADLPERALPQRSPYVYNLEAIRVTYLPRSGL